MSEQTADVLDSAADYIERYGWHQGYYGPGHPVKPEQAVGRPACATGAIAHAERRPIWGSDFIDAEEALAETLEIPWFAIPEWNDHPRRTEQEVLDAFRLAAKRERMGADGE